MSVSTTTLNTEDLVAGEIRSAQKTAATGTYYRGQVLGRVDATGVYGGYNDAVSTGLENVRAVCSKDTTLAAEGTVPVYVSGSEVNSVGLKDNAGAALTVTSTIIESAQDSGILIK